MSALALALRQVQFENRAFWRNPAAAFFTFVFPLMFLVIFNLVFGSRDYEGFGRTVSASTFYTPAIIAFAVINACYTNIAIGVSFSRDAGVLKRVHGTPLPAWAYLFGRIAHSIVVAFVLVVIVAAFGKALYDVELPGRTIPAFLASLAVGAASFCALGLAITAVVPNAEASPAVVNASILPILFISDIFIPLDEAPAWLGTVADLFPPKHLSNALLTAFNPFAGGSGLVGSDLLVMSVWGLAGLALAIRFFSWEPRR